MKNGEKIIRDNNLVKPFLVTYGYTNSATGLTKDNKFISKLSGQENEDVKSLLEAYWTVYSGKKKINRTPDKWGHKEKYYGGIITIPYEKSSEIIVDAIIGQGATSTVPTLGAVQARLRNKELTELNTNTSALNLIN